MPDVVDTCLYTTGSPYWQVYLNRGGGFSASQSWWSPQQLIRDLDDHVGDYSGGKTYRDTFDIDGDGMPDYIDFTTSPYKIYHSAGGAWEVDGTGAVIASQGKRTDLLEGIENGIGGSTTPCG